MPQQRKCHQDIKPPQIGHNLNTLARYVSLLACGLLALSSLTHILKDLPLTLYGPQEIMRHVVPLLHVVY